MRITGPTAEERFLLTCCSDPNALRFDRIEDVTGKRVPDWTIVRRRMREYPFGLDTGLMWPILKVTGHRWNVPVDILRDIAMVYGANAEFNHVIFEELAEIVDALNQIGVDPVVCKGAALILSLYKDLGVRRCADVDLLVPRDRAIDAEHCLRTRGYTSEVQHDARRAWYLRSHHHLPPLNRMRASKKVGIEIQWRTSQHAKAGELTERLWRASEITDMGGSSVRIPAAEHLFLHGVLDIWGHRFLKGIKPFCDLRLLALRQDSGLIWKKVESEVAAMGLQTETGTVLDVIERFWGPGMPGLSPSETDGERVSHELLAAAAECTLHAVPDRILLLKLAAVMLTRKRAAGPRESEASTELADVLHDARSSPAWLRRSMRQVWRVVRALPDCRAIIRNECAMIVVDHWTRRLADLDEAPSGNDSGVSGNPESRVPPKR